jgi:rfaE bifunctional protein kinase chain/domain
LAPGGKRIAEIVGAFPQAKVAVVGDFMADVYLEASPSRLSREAPVMVANWENETVIPGGAANAVNNLVALGASVFPVGTIGEDGPGEMLSAFFASSCNNTSGIVSQSELSTVSKMRVMVGEEGRSKQQVLRIDKEPGRKPSDALRAEVLERLESILPHVDAVLFSDYGYGLVDGAWPTRVRAHHPHLILTADSRYALSDFKNVDLVTPNHSEAEFLIGSRVLDDKETTSAARQLREQLGARSVLVTRGNRGMLLDDGERVHLIAASGAVDEVTDVSGAGDTVISVATLALVSGASPFEAAVLANDAAGVVVTKPGAATVSPEELLGRALHHS